MPKSLLKVIDIQAEAEARSRSGLIREALRSYLSRKKAWQDIFNYGDEKVSDLGYAVNDVSDLIDDYRSNK